MGGGRLASSSPGTDLEKIDDVTVDFSSRKFLVLARFALVHPLCGSIPLPISKRVSPRDPLSVEKEREQGKVHRRDQRINHCARASLVDQRRGGRIAVDGVFTASVKSVESISSHSVNTS